MEDRLSEEEKALLLEIARQAIVSYIETGFLSERHERFPHLLEKRGCFVTIKIEGNLRGCIGNFTSDRPLYQLVREMALSAALKDPRFKPMAKEELNNFTLEISVLTPLRKISAIDEIVVGEHGLYIVKNFSRGVLLPQVATEYGWDRETFLNHTSMKAGMEADAWKNGADIYIFSADVFNEK
jgi:AmmeMemoRadiSam system protein A